MTDESLTPKMHEVLFWLDHGQWHDPADLYQRLGPAHGVGSTLSAMEKRGLIELRRVQRGKYDWPEWRKLGSAADRAEDHSKQAIRALVIQVERFAWNREASARKGRKMWQRHARDRAAHPLSDATHFPPPTVH